MRLAALPAAMVLIAAATAPVAAQAPAGRYDATAEVPCAAALGQPMGRCPGGVRRHAGGNAEVVITHPDGRTRMIIFQNGRAVATDVSQADGDRPLRVTREADLNLIRVGPERYEIPDAFLTGG